MGLALPVDKFGGALRLGNMKDKNILESNQSLSHLVNHIIYQDELSSQYDTNQFLEDVENGLYFDSDIPQGYGLGSSGALVAAIYNQYKKFKKRNSPVETIKNELALLESYFHGKSSGLDALVSYLDLAVLIDKGEVTTTFRFTGSDKPAVKVFLVNTRTVRSTSTYVNLFLEKCTDKKFMSTVERSLIPTTNIAVDSFIKKNYSILMTSVKLISQLQFDLLPEFIPAPFKDIWKEGLRTNEYHLKICGAGGGGFIIGFAKEETKTDYLFSGKEIIELMKF